MTPIAATAYKLIKASTPFIDGSALWHIIVISLAAGAGLALIFGIALLGFERGEEAKTSGERTGGYLLTAVGAAVCVAIVAVGVWVMCNPPKSKPLKVVPATALVRSIERPSV
jgi:hypothetical protein